MRAVTVVAKDDDPINLILLLWLLAPSSLKKSKTGERYYQVTL